MKIIETSRTYLREYVAEDAGCLARILSDAHAMAYAPMAPTSDISVADGFIEWHFKNYAAHGFSAGQAGLLQQEHDVELFFSFLPEYWGRGLATEVALACRDHAFKILGLRRLISIIHPQNRAAVAVAAKVGMNRVGSLRLWERDNDLYQVQRIGLTRR